MQDDEPFYISPDTDLTVFGNAYRLVFVLDMNPSMSAVDTDERSRIKLSIAFET
jgi:hypothetical protein